VRRYIFARTSRESEGTVIDVKIFTRKGAERDLRSQAIEADAIEQLTKDRDDEIRILTETVKKDITKLVTRKLQRQKFADVKKKNHSQEG